MRKFGPVRDSLTKNGVSRPAVEALESFFKDADGSAADLTALTARVTAAEGAIDTAEHDIDSLEDRVDAIEAELAGAGGNTLIMEAGENVQPLAGFDAVALNIYADAGVAKVRYADASVYNKEADCIAYVAVLAGEDIEVHFEGFVTGTFTPGKQFLDPATPGGVTATAPSTDGQTVQVVGIATATKMRFTPRPGVKL